MAKVWHVLRGPGPESAVLGIHAPYPGRLMFEGQPGSLLGALAPLAAVLEERGEQARLGVLDPGAASPAFYRALEETLRSSAIRVVCISTSTAAIEEAARIVVLVRETLGRDVLVVVGGPHEDACELKVAQVLPGVDVSLAGEAGEVLRDLVLGFLESHAGPEAFMSQVALPSGTEVLLTSPWLRPAGVKAVGKGVGRVPPPRAWLEKRVLFDVFEAPEVLPVMATRGCPYGRCTFCGEAQRGSTTSELGDLGWLRELVALHPQAAVYFQDSIFPMGREARTSLLPLLSELSVEWGCQVYLPMLSREYLELLVRSGCRYIYTGLESGSTTVTRGVGKYALDAKMAIERLGWTVPLGTRVGVSLMLGALSLKGELLETRETLQETTDLVEELLERRVLAQGFYPNVQTVLPGTPLAHGLASSGHQLSFYRIPRTPEFDCMEDGGVGHNAWTLGTPGSSRLIDEVCDTAWSWRAVAGQRSTDQAGSGGQGRLG